MSPVMDEVVAWNGLGRGEPQLAAFEYDFAVDGGAVGAHTLRGGALPSGAVVLDTIVKTITPLTSGGAATVALAIEGAADVKAATAFNAAPYAAAGAKHGAVTRATDGVVLTAARSIVATVAAAAVTAGKFVVLVEFIVVKD